MGHPRMRPRVPGRERGGGAAGGAPDQPVLPPARTEVGLGLRTPQGRLAASHGSPVLRASERLGRRGRRKTTLAARGARRRGLLPLWGDAKGFYRGQAPIPLIWPPLSPRAVGIPGDAGDKRSHPTLGAAADREEGRGRNDRAPVIATSSATFCSAWLHPWWTRSAAGTCCSPPAPPAPAAPARRVPVVPLAASKPLPGRPSLRQPRSRPRAVPTPAGPPPGRSPP